MDAAEMSGLSAQGIYPKGNDLVHSARGDGGYRGDGARFAYSGWSCFSKQLAKAPKGWPAPMVMTWSNPVQIRLTDEGKMLGAWMHAAAETRGDCACGLMSAETVARAAERRRIVFGAAEPDERAPETRKALSTQYTAEVGKSAAPDAAALRRERARRRERKSTVSRRPLVGRRRARPLRRARMRVRLSARARGGGGGDSAVHGPSRATRVGAGAGAERRRRRRPRRRRRGGGRTRSAPFLSVFERHRSPPDGDAARRGERIRGAEGARPRGTRDADVSPRAARRAPRRRRAGASGRASTRDGRRRGRAPRLPPISAGKTFADESRSC